jgi:nucleoside-diphosphate-sugar epimerase
VAIRVIVIGGTGHIGSYLSPRLAEAGYDVVCVSRGQRAPYVANDAWNRIASVILDRAAEEATGTFGGRIADLQPDVVIDITCYRPESARQIVEALRGKVRHFLHCGTIWVHGHSVQVPTTEDASRRPFGDYGCRKAAIERYLLDEARCSGFPATVLHPGHLVGRGWNPINPAGNFNPEVFSLLAMGSEVLLPNLGMETLHHVHADDVAQAFVQAVQYRGAAIGESFHIVSASALTLRGYAESVAGWFKQDPRLRFLPWDEWKTHFPEKDAAITWDHIAHSPHCSIAKAQTRLGYAPRYNSLDAVREAVDSLIEKGSVKT